MLGLLLLRLLIDVRKLRLGRSDLGHMTGERSTSLLQPDCLAGSIEADHGCWSAPPKVSLASPGFVVVEDAILQLWDVVVVVSD